ncbi:MAG: hypothetical protein QM504_12265 [Pseudomonadota bacterium]
MKSWDVIVDINDPRHIEIAFQIFVPDNYIISAVDASRKPSVDVDIWDNVNGSATVNYEIEGPDQLPPIGGPGSLVNKMAVVFLKQDWDIYIEHNTSVTVAYNDGNNGIDEDEEIMATSNARQGILPKYEKTD